MSYFSFKPMKRRKFYFSNTQAFAFMRISVCKSFAFTCFKRVKYNCSNQKFLICCCFRRCLLLFVVFVVVFFFCLFIYLSIQYGFRTSFNILGEFTIVSVCFFCFVLSSFFVSVLFCFVLFYFFCLFYLFIFFISCACPCPRVCVCLYVVDLGFTREFLYVKCQNLLTVIVLSDRYICTTDILHLNNKPQFISVYRRILERFVNFSITLKTSR